MNLRIILCFSFSFYLNLIYSQYVPMPAVLTENSTTYRNAWAGGMNLPQFSELDLNNDGIMDLVSYDREGDVASTFINGGTAGLVDYHFAPEYMSRMPEEALNFMLFRDYNCDGIQDIFGMYVVWGQGVGLAVWKGSYDANDTIQFTLVNNQLKYDNAGFGLYKMFLYNTDLPAIDDIDGDGDLDILAFTLDICFPKNIFWYRNTSVEDGNNCDSLDFELANECWGQFEETGDSSIVNFSPSADSCYNNQWYNARPAEGNSYLRDSRNGRHIGANLTTVDFNGDNVKDLALGGVTYKNVNMVSGIDINDTTLINSQDYHFPSYDQPVDIYSFVSTYFLDVNNDGITDMLACPSETGIGESIMDSVVWFYENTASNNNMVFDFQQKDFLVGEMLDVGHRAFPAVFDHNADGLNDILIGGFGRPKVGGGFDYGMALLENTGTVTSPAFNIISRDYGGFSSLFLNGLHPTFGDIDGDGDLDMMCGAQDGSVVYIENTAGAGNPAVWATPQQNYKSIDVGDASAPFLVDLDRDNDLDLLIGQYSGTIHYFENGGSNTIPNFSPTPNTTNLGGYSVQNAGSRNAMPFVYDNNGAYELFIGHQTGNIIHLGNIDNDIYGVYDTLSVKVKDIYQGKYTDIAVMDFDNDSKLDYILGTGRGGLMIMSEKDTLTSFSMLSDDQKATEIYPNPTKNNLTVSMQFSVNSFLYLKIYNALGQVMLEEKRNNPGQLFNVNTSALPQGMFFIDLQTDSYQEVLPFVKE